jgi:AcrR family transcriptional regulator
MARGLTEVSMPAIAREAGVSIRTVYRHFPTKADVIDALAGHVFGRDELERIPPPSGLPSPGSALPAARSRSAPARSPRTSPMPRSPGST